MITLDRQDSASAVDELVGVERQIAVLKQAGEERLKTMNVQLQAAAVHPVTQALSAAQLTHTLQRPGHPVNPAVGPRQLEPQMMANHGIPYHQGFVPVGGSVGMIPHPVTLGRGMPSQLTTSQLLQGPMYVQRHGPQAQVPVDPWTQGHRVSQPNTLQSASTESPFTDPEIRSVGLPTLTTASPYPFSWNDGVTKL